MVQFVSTEKFTPIFGVISTPSRGRAATEGWNCSPRMPQNCPASVEYAASTLEAALGTLRCAPGMPRIVREWPDAWLRRLSRPLPTQPPRERGCGIRKNEQSVGDEADFHCEQRFPRHFFPLGAARRINHLHSEQPCQSGSIAPKRLLLGNGLGNTELGRLTRGLRLGNGKLRTSHDAQ